eukprot:364935-Chlamydomonas_euryale.AAC.6
MSTWCGCCWTLLLHARRIVRVQVLQGTGQHRAGAGPGVEPSRHCEAAAASVCPSRCRRVAPGKGRRLREPGACRSVRAWQCRRRAAAFGSFRGIEEHCAGADANDSEAR